MAIGATNYPGALDTATTLVRAGQPFMTELRLPVTSAETTIPVLTTTGATPDGLIVVNGEAITYESVTADAFVTCVRGALQGDGYRTPTSHAQGSLVTQALGPVHHRVMADAVVAVQNRLTSLAAVESVGGTARTLAAADDGRTLVFTATADVTVTVPAALPLGFRCTLVQGNTGRVAVVGSGATVANRQGHAKTAGQWAAVQVQEVIQNVVVLSGDTGA